MKMLSLAFRTRLMRMFFNRGHVKQRARLRARVLAGLEGLEERVVMSSTPVGNLLQGHAGAYQVPLNGASSFTAASVSVGSLPGGLSLNSAGMISGTPATGTQGTYSLTVNVTPSGGSAYDQPIILTVLPNQFVDPNYSANDGFGSSVVVLSGGNVVVAAPNDDAGGTDAGAVYLFNGTTGALISTLTGSNANDQIGSNGVTGLSNGNFVVESPNWNNGTVTSAGAVTWGSGTTGVSGVVSGSNSLVGTTANDQVGYQNLTTLSNGNYVVSDPQWSSTRGAVTWGSGTAGVSGVVSSSNSLIGTLANDAIGIRVTALTNGNYVVASMDWGNALGAVTWGNGSIGVKGTISSSNSLVGASTGDLVGGGTVTALSNGNYVVVSPSWSSYMGAVTWGSGTAVITGIVSSSNSLVGLTANDQVGSKGVTALFNGNYVVDSPNWDNGTITDAGAVTWGSGTTGVSGVVSDSNSLVGSTARDQIGWNGVTALFNGNYVVGSNFWNRGGGAVTWGSGTTGVHGVASSSNSLVGSRRVVTIDSPWGPVQTVYSDHVGSQGVMALSNGNYVVCSPSWFSYKGAVTWGSGTAGVTGNVSNSNSLVGSNNNDYIGLGGVTALSNGNYVVVSSDWSNRGNDFYADSKGAVTWCSGIAGLIGAVTSSNSLVGSNFGDFIGSVGVTPLSNGNYVVVSPIWDNGTLTDAGAVSWGSGTTGVIGVVSDSNSLVGSAAKDRIGAGGVTALSNGNYVVVSQFCSNGSVPLAGAVTWGNGSVGTKGVVSSANSLVGSTGSANDGDQVGNSGVTALSNGNYVVVSPDWNNELGAVTWGSGTAGITGTVSSANSLIGSVGNSIPGHTDGADTVGSGGVLGLPNGNYLALSPRWNNGTVANAGAVTFGNGFSGGSGVLSGLNSLIGPFTSSSPTVNTVTGTYLLALVSPSVLASGTIKAPTTTTVTSSANPSTVGGSVTFTATVVNGTPGGTVTFNDGSTTLGTVTLSGTTAVFTTSSLSTGSHSITAVYAGDSSSSSSTSNALIQNVNGLLQVGYMIQGNAGSYQIPLGGSTAFTAASVSVGSLPSGLSLSSAGVISGTPAAGTQGNYSLTLHVTPSGGSAYDQPLTLTVLANQFVDPDYSIGDGFGSSVVVLTGGNVVVTAPYDDAGGTDAGAVYLFNGTTGALISTLKGSKGGDLVGSSGVTALSSGNYVVNSPSWNALRGAVTWGNGTNGVSGAVSSSNSLIGSSGLLGFSNDDMVGSNGVIALSNGNYLVCSSSFNNAKGAVTWGSGTAGVKGVVSNSNSLVGGSNSEVVGSSHSVTVLSNGNYVVSTPAWNNAKGAATWGSGTAGVNGAVSSSNSLVGSTANDSVGGWGVMALTNGNYVVASPSWSSSKGAVTWGNGTAGVSGAVTSSNSLVGSTASDKVGSGGVTALTNGNYVVASPSWSSSKGAVTWGSGTVGIKGAVSSSNSLVGSQTGDNIGSRSVTALSNGNYVVASPSWSSSKGAVTWSNGTAGVTGAVSSSNSLIGSTANDNVGGGGVTALLNGNYVVASPGWSSTTGAATWGNGTAGITGTVSSSNSLVGSIAGATANNVSIVGDQVGQSVTALSNGNYVVASPGWNYTYGAATWGNGTAGITGTVSSANSLVGSSSIDQVSSGGVTVLTNGNYVVASPIWSYWKGAVTWGSGTAGIKGVVSSSNSLVGVRVGDIVNTDGDQVGNYGVTALSNGNYVVVSPIWSNKRGAVTWGSGTAGISGTVSSANSLVGSIENNLPLGDTTGADAVGGSGVTALPNGNYLVLSPIWNNGYVGTAGAVTLENGLSSTSGIISGFNSLIGPFVSDIPIPAVNTVTNSYLVSMKSPSVLATSTLKAFTTTTVTSSANPSTVGGSVTFTATVVSGTSGVTVTFKDGSTTLGTATLSGTTAAFTTSSLSAGNHSITAVYAGDSNSASSTSTALGQVVKLASTTSLASSANPSSYGAGVTFMATVTSGATGTVTFKDGSTTLGTGTISGTTATYFTSALSVGSHSITAVYGGDSNYSTSTSSAVSQTVNQASTTTTLLSSANPSTYGGSVTFTATVTSGATGTVTFKDGSTTLGTGTISGTTATFSTAALAAGNHSITAVYGGDSNYSTSTSSAVSQTVNQASTTTTLVSSANPSSYGNTVTFTATLTSGATGTVTFKDGSTTLGSGTISGNKATYSASALSPGSHSITAVYAGDNNYTGSTSSTLSQTVNQASSTTTLARSPNPSTFGNSVTFTATVTNGATGTVSFKEGSTTLGTGTITGTKATYSTSALSVGSHSITAVYGGDSNYSTSTSSAVSQTVNPASSTTTLVSSANPSSFGNSVTFTATVPSIATGTVTFKDGTTTLGTSSISAGVASFAISSLSIGSHSVTAVYGGDSNYTGSTSSAVSQTINASSTTTTLASSTNPSTFGGSVTFTAIVTGGATGTVTFKDGSTTLGTGTISGTTATYSTSSLSVGSHSITAVYGGDANHATSTSSALSQTVNKASSTTTVASSINNCLYSDPVTLTATVTSGATGTVTFMAHNTSSATDTTLGTGTISGGTATFTSSSIPAGLYTITAVYGGDTNYAGSTNDSQVLLGISQTTSTTSLASSVNPSNYGDSVTITASVPAAATGTVTFYVDKQNFDVAVSAGKAMFTTSAFSGGSHDIAAVYNGDNNYLSSFSVMTQTVNRASSTTTLAGSAGTITYGGSVTFTATVSGTATGTVTFYDGTTALGTGTINSGSATLSTSILTAGSHDITAVYGGDTNFAGSTSGIVSQTVTKANSTTNLTSSTSTCWYGDPVTFTVTVPDAATGSVTFMDGSTTLGTGTISLSSSGNTATFATSALAGGSHTITAVYNGDANYASSTSNVVSQTVNQASSSTTLSSSANPSLSGDSVTFTATVTSGATGSVTFMDGNATLGTGTISGTTATYSTSSLSPGSHSITAVYGGDSNYATSTSSALSQTVNAGSTTTTLTSSANPTTYGVSVTFTATISSGATGTVTFMDGSTTLGTGTLNNGTTTFSTSSLSPGSHSITAAYSGDSNYPGSTSSALSQTVNQASTSTTLASSTNPSSYGDSVTFTATVTSGATGSVTFKDGTTTLGTGTISGTTATYSTSSLSAGSHDITAVYDGDTNYASSTSNVVSQTVNQTSTTTTLVSSANPSTYSDSVTFTATVTSGATGTVTFTDGSTTLGTGTISGTTATYTTSSLSAGSHSITAAYGGDSNYSTSTSSAVSQTVNQSSTTTTLVSSANPSTCGVLVTFTATVTSGATGTVTFKDGSTTLGTSTLSGTTATYATSSLAAGSHSITAVYAGDSTYPGSTSNVVSQTVNKASSTTSLTSSANPSTLGDTVTFTATVTSGATGSVIFKDGTATLGTGAISGTTATFSTSALTGGSHSITAVYGGDTNFATSTSVAVAQVVAAAPVVTSNPSGLTLNAGATATFAAVGIGSPTPTVQWQVSTNGGSSWSNISGATSTSYTTPTVTAGNEGNQYRALFMNNLGSASTSAAVLHVNSAPAIANQPLNVTTNANSTATFAAIATGSPAPTVQWQKNTGSGWNDITGATSVSYTTPVLAAGDTGSQYRAVFTNTFGTVATNAATLTIGVVATVSGTSVGWGTQTASLVDGGNGRLLPAGRTTDIPWLGITKITLTLDQSIASLTASDITLKSAGGFTYSVASITAVVGSGGKSWDINLGGSGLVNPDKVTVTLGNSSVASYSKRLDILPGDVNDDGQVTVADQMLVQNQIGIGYLMMYDVDGSASLTTTDVSLVKSRIGKKLPA